MLRRNCPISSAWHACRQEQEPLASDEEGCSVFASHVSIMMTIRLAEIEGGKKSAKSRSIEMSFPKDERERAMAL